MNSKLLREMIIAKSGSIKAFAREVDIPYTTLRSSLSSDDRLNNVPVTNWIRIAGNLGMAAEELAVQLGYDD